MKVVVDTNVFISSFFGGNPKKIIDLWKTGKITLCLSQAIIEEYVEVMQRIGIKTEDIQTLLSLFAKGHHCLFAAKTPHLKIVKSDPDDDIFFECAIALDASHIISGDKAVLDVKKYVTVQTVSPKEFLEIIT